MARGPLNQQLETLITDDSKVNTVSAQNLSTALNAGYNASRASILAVLQDALTASPNGHVNFSDISLELNNALESVVADAPDANRDRVEKNIKEIHTEARNLLNSVVENRYNDVLAYINTNGGAQTDDLKRLLNRFMLSMHARKLTSTASKDDVKGFFWNMFSTNMASNVTLFDSTFGTNVASLTTPPSNETELVDEVWKSSSLQSFINSARTAKGDIENRVSSELMLHKNRLNNFKTVMDDFRYSGATTPAQARALVVDVTSNTTSTNPEWELLRTSLGNTVKERFKNFARITNVSIVYTPGTSDPDITAMLPALQAAIEKQVIATTDLATRRTEFLEASKDSKGIWNGVKNFLTARNAKKRRADAQDKYLDAEKDFILNTVKNDFGSLDRSPQVNVAIRNRILEMLSRSRGKLLDDKMRMDRLTKFAGFKRWLNDSWRGRTLKYASSAAVLAGGIFTGGITGGLMRGAGAFMLGQTAYTHHADRKKYYKGLSRAEARSKNIEDVRSDLASRVSFATSQSWTPINYVTSNYDAPTPVASNKTLDAVLQSNIADNIPVDSSYAAYQDLANSWAGFEFNLASMIDQALASNKSLDEIMSLAIAQEKKFLDNLEKKEAKDRKNKTMRVMKKLSWKLGLAVGLATFGPGIIGAGAWAVEKAIGGIGWAADVGGAAIDMGGDVATWTADTTSGAWDGVSDAIDSTGVTEYFGGDASPSSISRSTHFDVANTLMGPQDALPGKDLLK